MARTLATLVVGLLLTAMAAVSLYRDTQATIRAGVLDDFRAAADRMQILIVGLELSAQIVATEARRRGDISDLSAPFDLIRSAFPDFRTVVAIDPEGIARADMREGQPAVGIDVADRAYFRVHLTQPPVGLYIGSPVTSRVDGQLTFPVSTAIHDDAGRLIGVVVSSVDANYFAAAYGTTENSLQSELFLIAPGRGTIVAVGPQGVEPERLSEIDARYESLVGLDAIPEGLELRDEGDEVIVLGRLPTRDLGMVEVIRKRMLARDALRATLGPASIMLILTMTATAMVHASTRQARRERERRNMLDALRERLALAVEAGRIGIWEYAPDAKSFVWNERMFEIYGLDPKSRHVPYDRWKRLIHPEDTGRVLASLESGLSGTGVYDVVFRIVRPNGDIRHVKARAGRTLSVDTGTVRLIGVNQDVTQQINSEDALKRAVNEALDANQAKSNFLASMSHNLRTPLNAVLGYGELLALDRNERLGENEREYARHIVQAGTDLLDLVNDILDLMLLEADRISIDPQPMNIPIAVAECIAQITPSCVARGITIEDYCADTECDEVTTDRRRFKQIMLNLLSNAVRYNRDGGRIAVSSDTHGDGLVRIMVEDTGIGIPELDRDRIFDMFERLQANPHVAKDGIGIGLTISRLLARRLGGDIDFSSDVGVGSRFWVLLPLKGAADPTSPIGSERRPQVENV